MPQSITLNPHLLLYAQLGNDNIEFDEFLSIMEAKMRSNVPDENIVEAFHVFDRDNDGFISLKELQHVMYCLGE